MIIGLALFLIGSQASWAATWLDPSLKWKTIETAHFSIHYYTELEDIAKRFAPIAEEVHATMSKVLKYKIGMKTQVVLLDTTDYGNGFTMEFPYPAITLYLTDLGGNLNPYKYDDYLRYLFLHEYTHALHLDIAEGGVSIFRMIFGRVIFPNAMEPWFLTEGMATYMETRYTNAGRGRDPRWQMMMRMDVLEDNIKSLDQAAVDTVRWPMGHVRYLYGVMFLEYLSDRYGEEKLVALAHVYGDFLLSMGIDGAFTFIYGKNLTMLWNEWLDAMRDKYQKQLEGLGSLTKPQLLTQGGYYHTKPKWGGDSRSIYYLQRDADEYPQIRRLDTSVGKEEKMLEAMVDDDSLSLSGDGNYLLFSKTDIYKNYYVYKDIYALDLRTKKAFPLTQGARAGDPGISPDGKKMVLVRNEKGIRSLQEIRDPALSGINPAERFKTISSTEAAVQYYSPSYSPDGRKIIAAKYSPGGYQKIHFIEPESGAEKVMNAGDPLSTEANPAFSPDGEYVFFDSDRTGIVNLYAYHIKAKRLFQVTNVVGGAMMPDVSPDGKKIACISYSSNGYDVAMMDLSPERWKEVNPSVAAPATYRPSSSSNEVRMTIHDYDPLPTLVPAFWIPDGYYNENGDHTSIYIGSADPLQQHSYYLNLGYDSDAGRPNYSFTYTNDQFLPQISLNLTDLAVPYDTGTSTYWERDREAMLTLSLYDNRVFYEYDKQTLTLGLHTINLTNISSIEQFFPRPSRGDLNSFIVAYRYRSARSYAYSISPEDGIDLIGMVEANTPALGSSYNFTTYNTLLRNYFRSPIKHQVLATALRGFYSKGDQLSQSNFSWRYIYARGYPDTFLRGNKGVLLSLEYRLPLWYPEKGLLYGTTFFDRVWTAFFYDMGGATFQSPDSLLFKRGVGAELNVEVSNLWGALPMTLKLVYAKGLDEGGEEKTYFTIGL
jgi:Tol biopolymer transport system component